MKIRILFEPAEGKPDLTFVEVENERGQSVSMGEWDTQGRYSILVLDLAATHDAEVGRSEAGK